MLNSLKMMKHWNKTGKIKAIIIAIVFLINLLTPFPVANQLDIIQILTPLFFGCIVIPIISKFNAMRGREISKPDWNDSPFTSNPLSMFYSMAFFFAASGLGMVLGTVVKFNTSNSIGFTAISFGLGIFIGIQIMLKWFNNQIEKYSSEQKKIWVYAQLYDSLFLFSLDFESLKKMSAPTFNITFELDTCFSSAFESGVYKQILELDSVKSVNLKPRLDEFSKKVNALDKSLWSLENIESKPEWEEIRKEANKILNTLGETHNREFEKYYSLLPS